MSHFKTMWVGGVLLAALTLTSMTTPAKGKGVPYRPAMGPTVGTAVLIGHSSKKGNIAFRGIVVPLDEQAKAGVVFDADTMRIAAGWLEGGLILQGLPFTGGHGAFPHLAGEPVFVTRAAPGWLAPGGAGSDALADPRITEKAGVRVQMPPLGPLPKTWAHFKGHYLHGDQVVLRYTVGGAEVLESPSLITKGEDRLIVRSFQVKGDGKAMTLVLADVPEAETRVASSSATVGKPDADKQTVIGVGSAPTATKLGVADGRLLLTLPGSTQMTRFTVAYWRGATAKAGAIRQAALAVKAADLTPLTKGGPARWAEPIVTKGELSKDTKNAYVIDRVTVPFKNKYEPRMRIGGMDFFSDGTTAAVSTWDGDVWIVTGIDDDLDKITWRRFATGLHEPLGLKIVDDVIYTVADDQITRFHDLNNDGEADYYENFNNDWELTSGFHAFCFDLHTGPDGSFYFAFGAPVRGGGRSFERMGAHHGSIIKVSKDGSKLERYATGLRAPNGMGVSPTGRVTCGDNEGTFVPRCPIHWIDEGEFLGVVDAAADIAKLKTTPTVAALRGDRKRHLEPSEAPKPLAWLPKGVDNSGGGQAWVTSDRWGSFQGELLHMSYGKSSLYLVLKEEKGGVMQGGVVKFPLRFTSSCMRARFNRRDGQLYVAGLRGWQSNAGREGGFDRVRYTGKPVAMPSSLRVKPNGLMIGFTQKLDPELANDAESFALRAADIRWTQDYGSGEFQLGARETGQYQKGWTTLEVTSAKLQSDGRTIFVEVANMQPAHQMELSIDLETTDGGEVRTKVWHTVHALD